MNTELRKCHWTGRSDNANAWHSAWNTLPGRWDCAHWRVYNSSYWLHRQLLECFLPDSSITRFIMWFNFLHLMFAANFIAYELQLARNDPTRPTLLVVLGMLAKMPSVSALFAADSKPGIYFTKMSSNSTCKLSSYMLLFELTSQGMIFLCSSSKIALRSRPTYFTSNICERRRFRVKVWRAQ